LGNQVLCSYIAAFGQNFSQLKKIMPYRARSMQEKKKICPFRAATSRCQPQHTRTATYTTAFCKHFKPQKTKATQNKLIPEFCCESSSSFAQYSKNTA
jgi:hypothetical protein